MSLDGSSLDVADTAENSASFGYPGASRGESAFPQFRFVALVENGTHVLFGAKLGCCADGTWFACMVAARTARARSAPRRLGTGRG